MDREKVIKGLEHCTSHDDGRDKFGGVGKCVGCPYYGHDCTGRMKKDALALLKEQPEIVRCKDCKHRISCTIYLEAAEAENEDWFCASGEREA